MQRLKTVGLQSSDLDLAESAMQTLLSIGMRIREMRQARGLTLQALADAANLSASMLSLVERGRASPSVGTLIVIANALGTTISDLVVTSPESGDNVVVRSATARIVEAPRNVVSRLLKDDRARGISVAVNEYAPHTGNSGKPISHGGYEYGYVLEGELTVEVDGQEFNLSEGDLIGYKSTRKHKLWNNGDRLSRTLWFNVGQD